MWGSLVDGVGRVETGGGRVEPGRNTVRADLWGVKQGLGRNFILHL